MAANPCLDARSRYLSRHGGLWTDTVDAPATLDAMVRDGRVSGVEEALLRVFIRHGYAIIPGAVDDDRIAALLASVDDVLDGRPERHMTYWGSDRQHRHETATRAHMMDPKAKLLDLHWVSPAAQQAMFAPVILRFLQLLFDGPALAFQCLYFQRGSEQCIHQDTAFVPIADAPLDFVASWIALEDVSPGTGELLYVPGSHRLPDLAFASGKTCPPSDPAIARYEQMVRDNYAGAGLAPERFLPKKGDVLLWAADLCHGGAPITQPGATRRSMVTHYCPIERRPWYAAGTPASVLKQAAPGAYLISHS